MSLANTDDVKQAWVTVYGALSAAMQEGAAGHAPFTNSTLASKRA